MVQTRHQTHESEQKQQVEDPPNVGSEENMIDRNDQDSVGATSEVLSLQLVPLITQGQQNYLELLGIMKGMQGINSLTEKISSSLIQPQPPVVVLESLKPQISDAQRADRYAAPPRRDTELGQPLKRKRDRWIPLRNGDMIELLCIEGK